MLSANITYNLLEKDQLEALRSSQPERFQYSAEAASYINLKGVDLPPMPEVDEEKIMKLSRVIRAFCYAAIEGGRSGHPGETGLPPSFSRGSDSLFSEHDDRMQRSYDRLNPVLRFHHQHH